MQLINLKTSFLGRNLQMYGKIDSTQDEIWRLVQSGKIENGTLIMADIQTKGKGTHGRTWHTDEGKDIAFSFYIETNCDVKNIEGITIEIAECLVQIFKEKYGISLGIKFPNDIVCEGKKIGGILTESKINKDKCKYIVVRDRNKYYENEFYRRYKGYCNIYKKRIWHRNR